MQIGQLAQAIQKEPKDYMAVNLRSSKELDESRVERKNIEEEKHAEIGEEQFISYGEGKVNIPASQAARKEGRSESL